MSAGLGLSIAKLMVEQYGGSIGVEQSGVQGSSFWFTVHESAEGVGKGNLANDLREKGEA